MKENVLLKNYTTFKIGGPAKYFLIAKTKEDLVNALKFSKESKVPVFIFGGGSNILVSEKGFNGLVIKIDIDQIGFNGNKAVVGAGVNLTKLAYDSAEKGLSGLEWAAGIPGATIGGSIYGNAQAFGTKISDIVESVQALNLKTLEVESFTKEECRFSLKNSLFKENKNYIIIFATLKFENKNRKEIQEKIKEFLNYRKEKHPSSLPNAGSVFVNPEMKIENKKLLEKFPELEEFNKKGTIAAGYLIAKAGLVGKKIGGAQISQIHANFIINTGGATSKDVLDLIKLAKEKVK